jgi:ATP-dependent Clp protease ATP-binding subunit ClpX
MTCSFCGKDVSEVRFMVQGPDVTICEECVATCVEIMLTWRDMPVTDAPHSEQ